MNIQDTISLHSCQGTDVQKYLYPYNIYSPFFDSGFSFLSGHWTCATSGKIVSRWGVLSYSLHHDIHQTNWIVWSFKHGIPHAKIIISVDEVLGLDGLSGVLYRQKTKLSLISQLWSRTCRESNFQISSLLVLPHTNCSIWVNLQNFG